MPRKKQVQSVTLVGVRGAKLPVTDCMLVDVDAENYTVQTVVKTGRGRGTKTMLRSHVLPKVLVQYYFSDEEIEGEEAVDVPVAAKVAAPKKAPVKAPVKAAAPKKRGRPSKAAASTEEAAAPKKRGRPKGSTNKKDAAPAEDAAPAAPKKRGRPKGTTNKKADAKVDAPVAAPKKRGRPKGTTSKKAASSESKKTSKAASLFDDSF